jgi:CheY-like chemotaxis protein
VKRSRSLLTAAHPDVVLLDLHMPIMNGWEVLKALRDAGGPTPAVIVVSSLDVGDDSLPVFAEIHKGGIDADHLWATIRAAVRTRRRRPSRRTGRADAAGRDQVKK